MIIKITPDKQKSAALVAIAKITLERLEKTETERYPSNTLLDYYDIIHNLLEALTVQEGIKVKGEGAHQELIEYVVKHYGFSEQTRQFLQQLREYRNRISYEGFMVNLEFIRANTLKVEFIITLLFQQIEKGHSTSSKP
ncbi:MAG: hypothetical protein AABX13_00825 [Nanoarchaeota archaeon]